MEHSNDSNSDDESDLFCPALPPHLTKNNCKPRIVGPTLPKDFKPPREEDITELSHTNEKSDSDDEGDDIVGPLPEAVGDERFTGPEMEYRLKEMIADVSNQNKNNTVRESWMLELPSDKPNIIALGLGARQFKKKTSEAPGDRSLWTETPADRERKKFTKKSDDKKSTSVENIEDIASKKRDQELSELVSEYENKKRSVPLIDSHRSKKPKTDEKPKERRPFSREEDLNVNKFDEAQKETILKKARQLNDRFSSGNRKFL